MFSASNSFTVTAAQGSSVLVVPYDEYATNATGIDATPTIQWVTSGGTQTLLLAASQVSNAGSYTYAQVYYLFNPDVGSGTITLSGQGRAYAMNAYTLSGVNTSVPAPVPYVFNHRRSRDTDLGQHDGSIRLRSHRGNRSPE